MFALNTLSYLKIAMPKIYFDFFLAAVATPIIGMDFLTKFELSILPAMLVTAGQRLFFNTALQQPETYVEIARPEASDLPSEIAVCHFLDGAKTVIDWALSLPKFKALAQE